MQSTEPNHAPSDVSPVAHRVLSSDLARALKLSLFGGVPLVCALYLLDVDLTTILKACIVLVSVTFGLFALPEVFVAFSKNLKGISAIIEARAELLLARDLNGSGSIGDVIELEPDVKEVVRLVPTNHKQKVLISPNGTEVPVDDFVEFVRGLEVRGIERKKWVSDVKAVPSYKFQSGREMVRDTYDAMTDILEKRARVLHGRGKGTSGTLTASPAEILNLLGLE